MDETFNKYLNMEINVQKTKVLVGRQGNKMREQIKLQTHQITQQMNLYNLEQNISLKEQIHQRYMYRVQLNMSVKVKNKLDR